MGSLINVQIAQGERDQDKVCIMVLVYIDRDRKSRGPTVPGYQGCWNSRRLVPRSHCRRPRTQPSPREASTMELGNRLDCSLQ